MRSVFYTAEMLLAGHLDVVSSSDKPVDIDEVRKKRELYFQR